MNINFLGLQNFSLKTNKLNNFASNPFNFKGGLKQDCVELSERTKTDKRRLELLNQLHQVTEELKKLREDLENASITQREFNKTSKALRTQLKEIKDEIAVVEKTIEKEFLSQHSEFMTIEQIAAQAGNEKAAHANTLYRKLTNLFVMKEIGGQRYIDTSDERNAKNYQILLENLKGRIPLDSIPQTVCPDYVIKNMADHGTLDILYLDNLKTGKKAKVYLVPDEILGQLDNLNSLFPKQSKYYKHILQDPKDEILVPLPYLSKLGYGTPQQLYSHFKKGYLKGVEKEVEKDGKKMKRVYININTRFAEDNLALMRKQNKNFFSLQALAQALNVRVCEIEKAILNGELETANEYLFSSPTHSIGIDLNNPKNEEFAARLAFIEQTKEALLEQKEENKEKNKTLFGLKSKIAWALSPSTRGIASELAQDDGYLAKVLEKEARIKNSQTDTNEDESEEEAETLTKAEEIKLNQYRKLVWQSAGTEEYSQSFKQASEIVKLYCQNGIEAIKDDNIKKLIEDYMK